MERIVRSADLIVKEIQGNRITGIASVYWNGDPKTQFKFPFEKPVFERIHRGAWANTLNQAEDIECRYDHGDDAIGNRDGGSLKLWEDENGLNFDLEVLPTTEGNNVKILLQHKIIRGCSFAARVDRQEWTKENGADIKNILSFAHLEEISLCRKPCYTATKAVIRSIDAVREELEQLEYLKEREEFIQKYL